MPENIYGEIIPDRIDLGNSVQREYPKQMIVTIESLQSPNLGSITTSVRNHILQCAKSNVNPDVVLNFCIDYVNSEDPSENYIQKFISLAEYISDIKKQLPEMTVSFSVRGYFLSCMIPILYLDLPVKLSAATVVSTFVEDKDNYFKNLIPEFIEKQLDKKISRPFSINKELMIEQNLITI
jgi:hypothetical protein